MAEDLRELMHAEQPPLMPTHLVMLRVRNRVEARRRRRRAYLGISGVATVAVLAAASVIVPGHNLPRFAAGVAQIGMLTCGKPPLSTGPKAAQMTVALQAPASGQAGLRVDLQTVFGSRDGQPVTVDTGYPETYVVRDGYIIGKYPDDAGKADIAFLAVAPDGQSLPTSIVLSGCPLGPTDPMRPDASRRPLPPGRYDLVSVVSELPRSGTDRHLSVIVSEPVSINVTPATDARAP